MSTSWDGVVDIVINKAVNFLTNGVDDIVGDRIVDVIGDGIVDIFGNRIFDFAIGRVVVDDGVGGLGD